MITFKAIIIPNNKRADGTYPVKIRVYFNGKNRRIPTTLVCKQTDLTKGSLKIKNQDILSKADAIIIEMRKAVRDLNPFELENKDVDYVVNRIQERLKGNTFELDFFEWGERYIQSKGGQTRVSYTGALNALERFLGKRELDINDINRKLILDFMEYVDNAPKIHYDVPTRTFVETDKEKIAKGASTRHIMKLANIFKAAKDRYNDEDSDLILIPKSPFDKITKVFPSPTKGQISIGAETMQKIISAQTDNEMVRLALDVFVISFALMGANLADLYMATPVKDTWIYNRQKTKTRRADQAEMRVTIPEELRPFICRLQDNHRGWWLPKLHNLTDKKDYATSRVNHALKKWCSDNGVPEFTFYAARHTWASLARKAGVEKSLIDECLCHVGDYKMTDIYAERNWELINSANRKVLDMFNWE